MRSAASSVPQGVAASAAVQRGLVHFFRPLRRGAGGRSRYPGPRLMPGLEEQYYYWQRGPAGLYVPPSPDDIASVLALGPAAGWGLQEASGNPADLTGHGWNATAVGGSITYEVAGPTINGEAFKGVTLPGSSSGYFTVSSSLTDPSTSGFTISAWVKHPAGAGARSILYWLQTGQGTFQLNKGNDYGIQAQTWNTSNATHGLAFEGSDTFDDIWQFVAARYDSGAGVLRAYHDSDTFDDTTFSGTWKRDGNPACAIGGGGGQYWNGELALIFYWDGPLSDAQMDSLRTGVFASIHRHLFRSGRWHPTGAPAGDTTPPVISGVVETPGDTTCTISWNLDQPATGYIEYGTTTAYGLQTTFEPSYLTYHSQVISGLTEGTTYYYRIVSVDASGNGAEYAGDFDTTGSLPAPTSAVFGPAVESRAKGNLEMRPGNHGYIGLRFKALVGGTVNGIRFQATNRVSPYGAGDAGIYRVGIQSLDGAGKPSGTWLGNYGTWDPVITTSPANFGAAVTISGGPTLVAGQSYAVVDPERPQQPGQQLHLHQQHLRARRRVTPPAARPR